MSQLAAHMQKFKAGNIGGLENHVERKTENHKNKDINVNFTPLNFSAMPEEMVRYFREKGDTLYKQVDAVISEERTATRAVRSDAVRLVEWDISSDGKFFENLELEPAGTLRLVQFFGDTYEWFAKQFGAEHIPYATVHMDETTPHMHMGIIPLQDGRLTAKTIFTRNALKGIQQALPDHLAALGYAIDRGTAGSKRAHLTVEEYKQAAPELRAAKKEVAELTQDLSEKRRQLIERRRQVSEQFKQVGELVEHQGLIGSDEYAPEMRSKLLREPEPTGRYIITGEALTRVRGAQRAVLDVLERHKYVERREKELDQREKQVEEREDRVDARELEELHNATRNADLISKGRRFEEVEAQNLELKNDIADLSEEYDDLKYKHSTLRQRFDKLKDEFRKVGQAVNMFKYDRDGEFGQDLNENGSRLVDGIQKFVSRILRREDSPELAQRVEQYRGLVPEIKQELPLTQAQQQRAEQQRLSNQHKQQQGWGMER